MNAELFGRLILLLDKEPNVAKLPVIKFDERVFVNKVLQVSDPTVRKEPASRFTERVLHIKDPAVMTDPDTKVDDKVPHVAKDPDRTLDAMLLAERLEHSRELVERFVSDAEVPDSVANVPQDPIIMFPDTVFASSDLI